jgi:hypothetical protein
MIAVKLFLEKIGNMFIPRKVRPYIRSYLLKAGITKVPYQKFGLMFCVIFILTLILYVFFYINYLNNPVLNFLSYRIKLNAFMLLLITFVFWFIVQSILSLLFIVFIKFYYDIKIYNRTKKIEEVLPSFLQAVNVNLKAGMTFDKALWNAVESEFSVLEKEIEIVAKKEMTGEDITNALKELVDKYNSQLLKESMSLLILGIEEGGDITDIIEKLVNNVKEINFLKREVVAQVTNYIIFITIIATIISPLLFAFSFNLLIIIKSIASKITTTSVGASTIALPLFIEEIPFKPQNFITFSRLSISAISVASSFIIVNLLKGNIKAGIKYMPIFVFVSLLVYEISIKLLPNLFKGIF